MENLEDRTARIEQERAEVASAFGGPLRPPVAWTQAAEDAEPQPAAPVPIPTWADVVQLILAIAPQFKHELTVNALLADFPRWLSEVKSMRRVLDISQEDNHRLADRANDERTKRVEMSGRIEVMRATIAARLRTAPAAQAAFTFNRDQLEAWIRELESGAPSTEAEAAANANAIACVVDMLAKAGHAPDASCNMRENLINQVDRAIRTGQDAWERLHRSEERPAEALLDLDILFDGPPGPEGPRFVEVESPPGRSVCVGDWVEREPIKAEDGRTGPTYWALRIPRAVAPRRQLTRDEAIAIARDCALDQPQSYVDTSKIGEFAPHEWVISAIMRASSDRPHTFATLPSIPGFRQMARDTIAAAVGKAEPPRAGDILIDGKLYRQPSIAELRSKARRYRDEADAWRTAASYGINPDVKMETPEDLRRRLINIDEFGRRRDHEYATAQATIAELRDTVDRIGKAYDKGVELWRENKRHMGQDPTAELPPTRAELVGYLLTQLGVPVTSNTIALAAERARSAQHTAGLMLQAARGEITETTNGMVYDVIQLWRRAEAQTARANAAEADLSFTRMKLQRVRDEVTAELDQVTVPPAPELTDALLWRVTWLANAWRTSMENLGEVNKRLSSTTDELAHERVRTAGLTGARDKAVAERDSALSEMNRYIHIIERANKALDQSPGDDVLAGIERLRELRTKAMRGEAGANAHAGKAWAAIIEIAKLTGSPEETPNVVVQQVVTLQQTVETLRRQRDEARGVANVAEGEAIQHRDNLSDVRHGLTRLRDAYRRLTKLPPDASVPVELLQAALENGAAYQNEVREAHEVLTAYQVNETGSTGAILSVAGRIKAYDRREVADRDRRNEAIHAALDRIETEYSGHHPVERIDGIGLRLQNLEAELKAVRTARVGAENAAADNGRKFVDARDQYTEAYDRLRGLVSDAHARIPWVDGVERTIKDLTAAESAARGNIATLTASLEDWGRAHDVLRKVTREIAGEFAFATARECFERISGFSDQVITVANEAFGPFPVMPAEEAMGLIERGIFEMRQARTRREGVVATAQLVAIALEGDEPLTNSPTGQALMALREQVQQFEGAELAAIEAIERGEPSRAAIYPGPYPELRGRSREDVSPERLAELRALKPSLAVNDASARELRALANEVTRGRYESDLLRRRVKQCEAIAKAHKANGQPTSGDEWVDDARRGVLAAAITWHELKDSRRTAEELLHRSVIELRTAMEARRERHRPIVEAEAPRCPTAIPVRATVHHPDGTSEPVVANRLPFEPLTVDRARFLGLSPTADQVGRTLEGYGARVAYAKDCTGRAAMAAEVVVHPETGEILKDAKAYSAATPAAVVTLTFVVNGHEHEVRAGWGDVMGALVDAVVRETQMEAALPLDERVVQNNNGTHLRLDACVRDLHLPDDVVVIARRAGHGG